MDIQLKRGLLDVCVLAAIKDEDSYGYKIIKDLKPYVELSESTLYTILKRLESAAMLTVTAIPTQQSPVRRRSAIPAIIGNPPPRGRRL